MGISRHFPRRIRYIRLSHPRDPQQTTNCLLVRSITPLLLDPPRSKVKFYGRGRLGPILYMKTVNHQIYKRCLRHLHNALHIFTLESAPKVPRWITHVIHRKFLLQLRIKTIKRIFVLCCYGQIVHMNTYNEGNISIHHLTEYTRVSLNLLQASFLQKNSTKPQTPLSTSLSESIHNTLQQDDFITHVPTAGGKLHVYRFVQVSNQVAFALRECVPVGRRGFPQTISARGKPSLPTLAKGYYPPRLSQK